MQDILSISSQFLPFSELSDCVTVSEHVGVIAARLASKLLAEVRHVNDSSDNSRERTGSSDCKKFVHLLDSTLQAPAGAGMAFPYIFVISRIHPFVHFRLHALLIRIEVWSWSFLGFYSAPVRARSTATRSPTLRVMKTCQAGTCQKWRLDRRRT